LNKICVFDTSYVTDNLGDQIIMESVMKHLREIFPEGFFTGIPTHDYPASLSFAALKQSDHAFVGGTNMLSSHWLWYHQWKLRLTQLRNAGSPVLMGVGWHKYQSEPDWFTRKIYSILLNKEFSHSVRDKYTFEKLRNAGISNVIYTGCPTMWDLTSQHLSGIPLRKSPNVFFTLTGYLKNPDSDREFVKRLAANYERLFFWPQMYEDLAYLRAISQANYSVVEPSISGARDVLAGNKVDYVGMRLHCGVLALQAGVRSLIIEVDNRAAEIAKDTRLPTAKRGAFDQIEQWINKPSPVQLDIPAEGIGSWKSQFAASASSH
jgi:polysaccharide pyruvyl transferase WcaK-like protein